MTPKLLEAWFRRLASERNCLVTFNLNKVDIFKNLLLEEFLYRKACLESNSNGFLVVNGGLVGKPAIVMGISGKAQDFVSNINKCKALGIRFINRFTGGGTVLVCQNSVVASITCPCHLAPNIGPSTICHWGFETFYKSSNLFNSKFNLVHGDFVVEHDGDIRKIAGNAQAYNDKALVHHSIFLWNFTPLISQLLKTPTKAPKYRNERTHEQFLTSTRSALHTPMTTTRDFANQLCQALGKSTKVFQNKLVINVDAHGDRNIQEQVLQLENVNARQIDIGPTLIDEAIATMTSPTTKYANV